MKYNKTYAVYREIKNKLVHLPCSLDCTVFISLICFWLIKRRF